MLRRPESVLEIEQRKIFLQLCTRGVLRAPPFQIIVPNGLSLSSPENVLEIEERKDLPLVKAYWVLRSPPPQIIALNGSSGGVAIDS